MFGGTSPNRKDRAAEQQSRGPSGSSALPARVASNIRADGYLTREVEYLVPDDPTANLQ